MFDVVVLQVINLELGYCFYCNLTQSCPNLVIENLTNLDLVFLQLKSLPPCNDYTTLFNEYYLSEITESLTLS
jgi:hypothetical protein